jgi:ABC-type phosphate/phosphonate transport system substrate-binding protein
MGALDPHRRCVALLLAAVLLPNLAPADDGTCVMLIQPLPHDERIGASYQPLARYIETLTGRRCTIQIPPNFPAYWDVLRRNNYDIALDGPHFTDYRAQKFGFHVLAKIPDTASYSLITRAASRGLDPTLLVGRRIASLGLLSMGATRLSAMFPNPVRQPVLLDVRTADEAIDLLLDKRVEAAFLPTAVVGERLRRGGIAVILTTEPAARLMLSASNRMSADTRGKIRDGLLRANETAAGQALLQALDLPRFEAVTPESFANQRNVLKSYWGY